MMTDDNKDKNLGKDDAFPNGVDGLIDSLCDDLPEQTPCQCPIRNFVPWMLFSVIFAALTVYFVGVRHDLLAALSNNIFLFEICLGASISVFAGMTSAFLMMPDMRGKKWLISVTLTLFGVFVASNVIKAFTEGLHLPRLSLDHCMNEGVFISIVPLIALMFIVRCGAPTRPIMLGVMNMLSVTFLGYVALRFTCPMDTVGQTLIIHLLPYVFIGAIVGVFVRRIFKW